MKRHVKHVNVQNHCEAVCYVGCVAYILPNRLHTQHTITQLVFYYFITRELQKLYSQQTEMGSRRSRKMRGFIGGVCVVKAALYIFWLWGAGADARVPRSIFLNIYNMSHASPVQLPFLDEIFDALRADKN